MIRITNNTKEFMEKLEGEIFIYGAGNAGYWVGYYMKRCNILFSGYIDKRVYHEKSYLNGELIMQPNVLRECDGKQIRLIISPSDYKSVMFDLLWMDYQFGINAICLVPRYRHISTKRDDYHINKLLAYFRRKLLVGTTPTIISNNCISGFIYDMLDMVMLSPTINTGLSPKDFLKLCKNPQYYLSLELTNLHWQRPYGNPQKDEDSPVGELGDISIEFGHTDSIEGIKERWELMCKKINWDRLIFIMCTEGSFLEPMSISDEQQFLNIQDEHLMVVIKDAPLYGGASTDKVFLKENYFAQSDSAIENYFDLLGWLNQEYKDD